MKYFNTFLLLVAIALLAYGTLHPKQEGALVAKTAYDRVIETGVLRCGYALSPPILVKDVNTGKISGLDVDVWEEIGKQLGLKVEWAEEVGYGNFIEGLRAGRYDAFCAQLWPETSRSKYLSLAGPVLYSFTETYVRADDFRFDGALEKINNSEIIIPVVDGDISYEMANRFPLAKKLALTQMSGWPDMLESVLTKKADVLFFDQSMIYSLPEEQRNKLRRVPDVPHSFTFPSYYGFKAGEVVLRDAVDIALHMMVSDGRLKGLAAKYSANYTVPNTGFMKGK